MSDVERRKEKRKWIRKEERNFRRRSRSGQVRLVGRVRIRHDKGGVG